MTAEQRRTRQMRNWAAILERAGVPRAETEAVAGELWQSMLGHGARVTWLPDDPDADPVRQPAPGDHRAALAALRAEVRPATPAPAAEPDQLLAAPPWRTETDRPAQS